MQKIIHFDEITEVKRAKTAGIFPTAIELTASEKKVVMIISFSNIYVNLNNSYLYLQGSFWKYNMSYISVFLLTSSLALFAVLFYIIPVT